MSQHILHDLPYFLEPANIHSDQPRKRKLDDDAISFSSLPSEDISVASRDHQFSLLITELTYFDFGIDGGLSGETKYAVIDGPSYPIESLSPEDLHTSQGNRSPQKW